MQFWLWRNFDDCAHAALISLALEESSKQKKWRLDAAILDQVSIPS
jgi:hypothetical protein